MPGTKTVRRYLRSRQMKHTVREPKDWRANHKRRGSNGDRPTGFDSEICNAAPRSSGMINRLKNSRAVATRYDKITESCKAGVALASLRSTGC